MARWKYKDLPDHIKKQVTEQRRREIDRTRARRGATNNTNNRKKAKTSQRGGKQPNKTEQRYRDQVLTYFDDVRYEAITFKLENGCRYTPDWVVFENGKPIECHECKGSYRFASHGRSRMAFLQAQIEFHGIKFFWAVWRNKAWEIEERQ